MLCGILISGKWSLKEKTLIGTHTDMINFLHVIPRNQSSFTFLVFSLRSRSTRAHLGCKMSWERENWGRRIRSGWWDVGHITVYNENYLRKKPCLLHYTKSCNAAVTGIALLEKRGSYSVSFPVRGYNLFLTKVHKMFGFDC